MLIYDYLREHPEGATETELRAAVRSANFDNELHALILHGVVYRSDDLVKLTPLPGSQ